MCTKFWWRYKNQGSWASVTHKFSLVGTDTSRSTTLMGDVLIHTNIDEEVMPRQRRERGHEVLWENKVSPGPWRTGKVWAGSDYAESVSPVGEECMRKFTAASEGEGKMSFTGSGGMDSKLMVLVFMWDPRTLGTLGGKEREWETWGCCFWRSWGFRNLLDMMGFWYKGRHGRAPAQSQWSLVFLLLE